jgi:hypothetical protein
MRDLSPSVVVRNLILAATAVASCGTQALAQGGCPGDLNGTGQVDAVDMSILLGAWGGPGGDVNGDGLTGAQDLAALLAAWGECPGCSKQGWIGGFGQYPSFGTVRDMIEFNDGSGMRLWIGGSIGDAAGTPATLVACWDGARMSVPTGGLTSNTSAYGSAEIFDLEIFNGSLYAAGTFNFSTNVAPVNGIARWDGAAWQPLGTGVQQLSGLAGAVFGLEVYQGQLYAAGDFDFAGGIPVGNLARWDGSNWTAVDVGVSGTLRDIETFNDGTTQWLVVGGVFNRAGTASTTSGGIIAQQIARWSPSTGWQPFLYTPPGSGTTYNGLPNQVFAIEATAVAGTPALYFGGAFDNVAGNSASDRIVRWSGNAWSALASGLAGLEVEEIELDESGGGLTVYAAGTVPGAIVRFTGTGWAQLDTGLSGGASSLRASAIYRGQFGFLVGGLFFSGSGRILDGIASWNGSVWSPLLTGLSGNVNAIVPMPGTNGTQVFLGGQITEAGGRAVSNAVVWDGAGFMSLGGGVNGTVTSAVEFQGSLIVGGSFSSAGSGGLPVSNIARWNGTTWTQLLGGVNGAVTCMEVIDGILHVGGSFTSANSQAATAKVARWNGSAWSSVAATTVPTPTVRALAQYQGKLYVGGNNTGTGLPPLHRLDNGTWTALLGPFNGVQNLMPINAMKVVDFDGAGPGAPVLAVGGSFTALVVGGVSLPGTSGVGLWNGTTWSGTGTNIPSGAVVVQAMAAYPEGTGESLAIVGQFATVAGQPIDRVARYDGAQWLSLGASFPSELPSASVLSSVGVYQRGGKPELLIGGNFRRGPAGEPSVASWGCRD